MSNRPNIKTTRPVRPMIYAYTTPGVTYNDGWVKIGYTERDTGDNVSDRVDEQGHEAGIIKHVEWKGMAIFDDGSFDTFRDTDFHAYLRSLGYEQRKDPETGRYLELFRIDPKEAEQRFNEFRKNRGVTGPIRPVIPYSLRDEQDKAVRMTIDYRAAHPDKEFLWNAKPRFGKTLSTFDFCKKIDAQTVLIVTNRPAIANSWFSDYATFFGEQSGYRFVSEVEALKETAGVLTREQYANLVATADDTSTVKCIEFVSLQDMKGSIYFGGEHDKLKEVSEMNWDVLVIDEAHEGVDTYKTDRAFDRIKRGFTLHLSGTPFKALANDKFPEDAIYNWTYPDEQRSKRDWNDENGTNPYATLPKLSLYTYQMSEIVKDDVERGIEINGETEEYAFDLNEFFKVENGRFVYDKQVDRFLNAMTTQERFPFSTKELRQELKHTFWLLNRVDSARLLAKKLREHPVFENYEIVLAAGDGAIDDDNANEDSFKRVRKAIEAHERTITLSVGQLTTGITIPEWTAVLMLSNVKSPSLYMQAAFRSQNPCLFRNGTEYHRKENAYVFDFDPARTLTIFEEFANDLLSETAQGRGDTETRKKNVRELLNFFPVLGEDADGELIMLDAEQILTIPRKIKSQEVVRRGFMSNFLFQNVSGLFSAPAEFREIIEKMEAIKEPKKPINLAQETKESLSLDDEGNVSLTDDYVIGRYTDVFGDKIYGAPTEVHEEVVKLADQELPPEKVKDTAQEYKELVKKDVVDNLINHAQTVYGTDMKAAEKRKLESSLAAESERIVDRAFDDYKIQNNILEKEHKEAVVQAEEAGLDVSEVHAAFERKKTEVKETLKEALISSVDKFTNDAGKKIIETVETKKKERQRDEIEDGIRDHIRGFARTIPSFLMAYGTEDTTLGTFDTIVSDEVFQEVTRNMTTGECINLEEFRKLRDGYDYTGTDGEPKHSPGVFDEIVFNDSIKEFLGKRKALADYFNEANREDIFDYIPPQRTNQIFTPKNVVKKMVDMLEQENPGCFDQPDKTFIDLYMKSGLYITEIVKRLYNSEKMQELYPNGDDRLRHIFGKQVYGLAPTEIIYHIALNYILGFREDVTIPKHNLRQLDALPYAKGEMDMTLEEKLDELFGGDDMIRAVDGV